MQPERELAQETASYKWNGLYNNWWFEGLERPRDYRPGFYHPVHLNDYLGAQKQYRVLYKLSASASCTVWLCRVRNANRRRYVAVKIRSAWASTDESLKQEREMIERLQELAKSDPAVAKYCVLPIEQFQIKDGPNGAHQCFVYPALGSTVTQLRRKIKRRPSQFLRHLAYQAAEAVAALHRHSIVHGDLKPAQFLLRDDAFTGRSSRNLIRYLGPPDTIRVHVQEGYAGSGPHAPDYLVNRIDYDLVEQSRRTSDGVGLVDFSKSFLASSGKPARDPRRVHYYSAPEVLLDGSEECSAANDIWALACIIYEIRTGTPLFNSGLGEDELLYDMVSAVGRPLPEPWWSTTWEERPTYFKDKTNARGLVMNVDEESDEMTDYGSSEDETDEETDDEPEETQETQETQVTQVTQETQETQVTQVTQETQADTQGETQAEKVKTQTGGNNGNKRANTRTLTDEDIYYPNAFVNHSDNEEDDSNVTDLEYSSEEDDFSESDGNQSDDGEFSDGELFWGDYDAWSLRSMRSRLFAGSTGSHKLGKPDGSLWTNDSEISSAERKLLEDLLRMMLKYDPTKRPTAEQVLKHPYFSFNAKKAD